MSIVLQSPPKQNASETEWQQWWEKLWHYVTGTSVSGGIGYDITQHLADHSNPHDVTWNQIDKTTASIDDINDHSHLSLTDVGTNTHADIDTHILDVSNPHSVTMPQVTGVTNAISGYDPIRYALIGI